MGTVCRCGCSVHVTWHSRLICKYEHYWRFGVRAPHLPKCATTCFSQPSRIRVGEEFVLVNPLWPPPSRVLLMPSHHLSRTIIFPSYSSPAKVATGEIFVLCNTNQLQTDSGGIMFCHCQIDLSSILNHLVHDVPAAPICMSRLGCP
jgi:hypothetical protein